MAPATETNSWTLFFCPAFSLFIFLSFLVGGVGVGGVGGVLARVLRSSACEEKREAFFFHHFFFSLLFSFTF